MPCDQHVQISSKQASRTTGRPPGKQRAASSKRPGVAFGTVRALRNLGPPQRANPLQPPFPTASSQGESISSQRAVSSVSATTAAEFVFDSTSGSSSTRSTATTTTTRTRSIPTSTTAPDGDGGACCNIRNSARGTVQSVMGTGSFDSVSASSPVTATLPSDPGAEAEGPAQARFNTYVKTIVNHQVKHFSRGPRHRKQTGKLQLDSPWVYPR